MNRDEALDPITQLRRRAEAVATGLGWQVEKTVIVPGGHPTVEMILVLDDSIQLDGPEPHYEIWDELDNQLLEREGIL